MISYYFQNPNFNSPIPDSSEVSYNFDYIAQSLTDNYPPESATAAQQAGVDHVVNVRDSYSAVGNSIINNLDNYKAWTNGNYTKYADTLQSILTAHDASIHAAIGAIEGRSECGETDVMYFSGEVSSYLQLDYDLGMYDVQSSIYNMYGLINTELSYSISSVLWTCIEDFDPVGCYIAAEESLIYPNQDLMNAQIVNVGETIISIITNAMDARVANIQTKIDGMLSAAASWECNGN